MPEYDVETLEPRARARIVKTAVTPRPIVWVSSRSEAGVDNLAPYSSHTYISSSDPVVLFNSPAESAGGLKDSARNAVETGEFAVNTVTEALLEPMDRTSERVPPGESEFELAGVEAAECRTIDAPRVADAVVTMECTLYDTVEVHGSLMVLGEVQHVHVAEGVLTDGQIDSAAVDTVGRLGGPYYTVSEPHEFERQF